jgi:hypothetical protein
LSRKKKNKAAVASREVVLNSWTPPVVAGALAVLWTVGVAIAYFQKNLRFEPHVWRGFTDLLSNYPRLLGDGLFVDILHVMGFWALAWRLGRYFVGRLQLSERAGIESVLLAAGLGAGSLSLLLFGLGIAHVWEPVFLQVLFYGGLFGLAAERVILLRVSASTHRPAASQQSFKGSQWHWGELAALFLVFCALLLNVMASQAPEIFYDSLVYHLALPRLYLLRGAIVATPENVYSGIPLGLQMLFGWALALRGENLAALLHASFGLGTAWTLWAWARRYAAPATGMLAALLFTLLPLGMYGAWHCGVDLGSSFYVVAAFLALSRALDDEAGERAVSWAIAAGLLTGMAMSTKYNVFPVGVFLILTHLWLARRAGRPFSDTVKMALAAGVVLGPWLLKNIFFYGNPLYPFLNNVIGWTQPADWKGFVFAAGSKPLAVTFGSWAGFKAALVFPWMASFANWPLGDWPGPAYIALVPWALLMHWGFRVNSSVRRPWTAAAVLAFGGYVSWLLASNLVRYVMPSLPLIALVAALAVDRTALPRWARRLGWVGALIACVYCFQAAFRQGIVIGQWHYLHGKESKATYLMRQRTTYGLPYYSAAMWINKNAAQDARVLVLGESRAYYLERDFISATVFDHHPFWMYAQKEAKSGKDIADWLRARGINYILLSAGQMHYRNDSNAVFPKETIATHAFGEFWAKWLDQTFEDRLLAGSDQRWLAVYVLRGAPKAEVKDFTVNAPRDVLRMLGYQVIKFGAPKYSTVKPTTF